MEWFYEYGFVWITISVPFHREKFWNSNNKRDMTQVFIVCVCSVIKNSQETGLFIALFGFVLFFDTYSASLFMFSMSLNLLMHNGRTQKVELTLRCSLHISFSWSGILNRSCPTSQTFLFIPVQLFLLHSVWSWEQTILKRSFFLVTVLVTRTAV